MHDKSLDLQSWSIVIFGFNEGHTIETVIRDAYIVLQRISSAKGEILVVDDGSTDNSRDVVNKLRNEIPCMRTIFHEKNMGIGMALTSGYENASCENVCAIPADGQFNITQLCDCPVLESNTILSFFREKNEIYSPFRKMLSWCNRQILKHIFGVSVRDVNWVKVYKNDALKSTHFNLKSSIIESELCIKMIRNGVQLIEVPTLYLPRHFGKPKGASFKTMTKAIFDLPGLYLSLKHYNIQ